MKRTLITAASLLLTCGAALHAEADVVTAWNSAALSAIRVDRTPPPTASHALAILHISIYDAVNGITCRHEPYLVQRTVPASASKEAAASAAAHKVLITLFPTQTPQLTELHDGILAETKDGPQKEFGITSPRTSAPRLAIRWSRMRCLPC
jgi:hypothetical protein